MTKVMRSHFLLAATFLSVGFVTVAHAQESSEKKQLDTVLVTAENEAAQGSAEQGYRVDDIGYGVSGFNNLSKLDTPYSVTSFSEELIQNQSIESIKDLTRFDASLESDFASLGYYPSVNIRGLGLNNWSNYRLNGLMIVNQAQTALENKERVEILKGLSALQAGFSSPGGIVNYVTKRPTDDPLTNIHVGFNNFGNKLAHADVSRRVSDKLGIRINVAAEDIETYVDEADGERYFISLAADWDITDNTQFQFDIEHQNRDTIAQPGIFGATFIPDPIPDPETFLGQEWATYQTQTTTVSAKLTHALNDNWKLIGEANYMYLSRDDRSGFADSLMANGDFTYYAYLSDDETREPINTRWSANGVFETGSIKHNLTFGVSTYYQETEWGDSIFTALGTSNIYNPVAFAFPSAFLPVPAAFKTRELTEYGIFANDVISLNKQWDIHLGGRFADVRYKSFSSTDGSFTSEYKKNVFSPSAAVVFKPASEISTYVSYTEGLEQGGTAPVGTVNANDQLDPLESRQYEAGIKAEVYDNLLLEAAVFQIERAAEFTNSSNVYVQDGEQRHRGIELSATGKVSPEWTVLGSVLLLDAELKRTGDPATEGKKPQNVPELRMASLIEYAPEALPGWTFSGNWRYTDTKYVNAQNTLEVDDYHLFGAGTRYKTDIHGTPTTIRLNVENITDEKYYDSSAFGYLLQGEPRTAWLTASFEF